LLRRKTEWIKQTIDKQVLVESKLICNKCGLEEDSKEDDRHGIMNSNFHDIGVSFEYGSKFDGDDWDIHICESCLVEFVKTFKWMPDGFKQDWYNNGEKAFTQDDFDKWKLQK